MTYISYSERMQVTVPVGEYEGLRVEKFQVKGFDTWTEEDKDRPEVVPIMEYARMIRDGR